MKKWLLQAIVVLVLLASAGCQQADAIAPEYKGPKLSIAVVGEIPTVHTKKVSFTSVSLDDVSKDLVKASQTFDALFVMKSQFSIADDDQYVPTYRSLTIPTFFIGTEQLYLPFVNEDSSYEHAPSFENVYAAGFLDRGTEKEYRDETWEYTLPENKKTEAHIQAMYADIFDAIQHIT